MNKKQQHGVAMLEFALVLPFLLLLTFIVTEFGRAIYQYNTITKSVRDAARYLSMQTPGTHITEARNLIVYGNTAGTGTPLAQGLSLANVPAAAGGGQPACCVWQLVGSGPVIRTVTIQVTDYTFHSLVPSMFGVNFGDIAYGTISATMRSQL
jgi:TadE-like protein